MTRTLKEARHDTGVIIGRFQVAQLHDEHQALINTVKERCDNVIIFLGLAPTAHTKTNPLDYQSRKVMIRDLYPDIDVFYIEDVRSDDLWSQYLDAQISRVVPRTHSVALYGSRESFINHYSGKYPTVELEANRIISGTEQRDLISRQVKNSPEFRAGQIFSAYANFPVSYQTVDVLVYDRENDRVLLGRKPGETKFRFFGGFVDPTDESLEHAAARELEEEAGVTGHAGPESFKYLGSFRVDDWRYRTETNKIMTCVYQVDYLYGNPSPGDDIEEVFWLKTEEVFPLLTEEHQKIWERITIEKVIQ